DDGCQSFIRLVEQEELDVARERAGYRKHLLLAARQRHALLLAPLREPREMCVDLLERPASRFRYLRELEILFDGQPGDDAAVFLNELNAMLCGLIVLETVDCLTIQPDLADFQLRFEGTRERTQRG